MGAGDGEWVFVSGGPEEARVSVFGGPEEARVSVSGGPEEGGLVSDSIGAAMNTVNAARGGSSGWTDVEVVKFTETENLELRVNGA